MKRMVRPERQDKSLMLIKKSSKNFCLPNFYFIPYFALSRKKKSSLSLPQKHHF